MDEKKNTMRFRGRNLLKLHIRLFVLSKEKESREVINKWDILNYLVKQTEVIKVFDSDQLERLIDLSLRSIYKKVDGDNIEYKDFTDEVVVRLIKNNPDYYNKIKSTSHEIEYRVFNDHVRKDKSFRQISEDLKLNGQTVLLHFNNVMKSFKKNSYYLVPDNYLIYNLNNERKAKMALMFGLGKYEIQNHPNLYNYGYGNRRPDFALGLNGVPLIFLDLKLNNKVENIYPDFREFSNLNFAQPLRVIFNGVIQIPVYHKKTHYNIYLNRVPQRKLWLDNKELLFKEFCKYNAVIVTKKDQTIDSVLFNSKTNYENCDELSEVWDEWGRYSRKVLAKSLISSDPKKLTLDLTSKETLSINDEALRKNIEDLAHSFDDDIKTLKTDLEREQQKLEILKTDLEIELEIELKRKISTRITQALIHTLKNSIGPLTNRLKRQLDKGPDNVDQIIEKANELVEKSKRWETKLDKLNLLFQNNDIQEKAKKYNFLKLINSCWETNKGNMKGFSRKSTLKVLSDGFERDIENIDIFIDNTYFDEVFTNLFTNSYRHGMYPSIKDARITIKVIKSNANYITVTYEDNGIGMTREKFEEVFFGWSKESKDKFAIGAQTIGLILEKLGKEESPLFPVQSDDDSAMYNGIQFELPLYKK